MKSSLPAQNGDPRNAPAAPPPLIVLKFGSSVLRSPVDLSCVVSEVYRHVRKGEQVIAIVSAFAGTTDRLFDEARSWSASPNPPALAARVATGEIDSATQLVFALERAGISAAFLDPRAVGLRTHGGHLDAEPVSIDLAGLQMAVAGRPVNVMPGFYGLASDGGVALLGRGGSDLTAVYVARHLGARCVLVKDVDGVYESDPAGQATRPRRLRIASYEDGLRFGGPLVQPKAIECARAGRQCFEIRAIGAHAGSIVGPQRTEFERAAPARPLRVVLLGLGTVGRGVYEYLAAQPERFQLQNILVRDARRHAIDGIPPTLLTTDPAEAMAPVRSGQANVLIETLGGLHPALSCVVDALTAGCAVVTANKELVARHWSELSPYLTSSKPLLHCSAAVGGAVPMLELVRRLAGTTGITSMRGIVNGTCNFILDRLADGLPYTLALQDAQALGFAEADPTADVEGHDSARKLDILCRLAWGAAPRRLEVTGIAAPELMARHSVAPGERWRLVASVGADLVARVAPMSLPATDYLSMGRGAENRLEVVTSDGVTHRLSGQGAGRWPTATAILADLIDIAMSHEADAEALASEMPDNPSCQPPVFPHSSMQGYDSQVFVAEETQSCDFGRSKLSRR